MVNYHLKIILIIFLLFSCKKVTEPVGIKDDIRGVWQESFTWSNFINCIPIDDDYSHCEKAQTSQLTLTNNSFTVKITPCVNTISDTCDTLYSGIFSLKNDTIIFKLNRDSSIHEMLYQYYDDSLEIRTAPTVVNDSIIAIEINSFLWGNAFNKYSGTFYRIQ